MFCPCVLGKVHSSTLPLQNDFSSVLHEEGKAVTKGTFLGYVKTKFMWTVLVSPSFLIKVNFHICI